jgi:hypothetical protein
MNNKQKLQQLINLFNEIETDSDMDFDREETIDFVIDLSLAFKEKDVNTIHSHFCRLFDYYKCSDNVEDQAKIKNIFKLAAELLADV